jgi:hypothetical protein
MIARKRKTPRREDEGEEEEEMDDDLEKRGKVLLWDLLVNDNDDVCFKHILPRLNSNEVKFLYEVNTQTRKLIKRSSRAKDLKEKFKVEEMSSISTLEFVWENKSLWPIGWRKDESWFCYRVAKTNKLESLNKVFEYVEMTIFSRPNASIIIPRRFDFFA